MLSERTLAAVLDTLQAEEGGVADIGDGAGTTYYGQTGAWLAQWSLPVPQTPQQARQNWVDWLRMTRFDQLPDDYHAAIAVVDYAVNSGERAAVRALQRAIGMPGASQDGIFGKDTLAAVQAVSGWPEQWTRAIYAARFRTLGDWVHNDPTHALPSIRGVINRVAALLEG